MIYGVQLKDLTAHDDDRGGFSEVFRSEWFPHYHPIRNLQVNNSWSDPGVLRGLHYHHYQFDYWYVVRGRLKVGLVDLRKNSSTYKQIDIIDLPELKGLFIPPLVAHGFVALVETELVYIVNQTFNPEDELSLNWQTVDWKIEKWFRKQTEFELSDRDRNAPDLETVLEELYAEE